MSMQEITDHTLKGAAIVELQNLNREVVGGDAAATNIPVALITTKDTLRSVLQQDSTSGVFDAEQLADASITSDGNIQLATVDSTGKTLIVEWAKKPEGAVPND